MERTEHSDKPDLQFEYDAMGNRIAKHVIHSEHTLSTFYVRDAEGNSMATYTKTNETELALEEQPIYGSSRLGVYRPTAEPGIMRGARTYEATNHLGNVLATYTDRIIVNDEFEYSVDVSTVSDYYPFGSPMQGRSFNSSEYLFGFNGKENITEVSGWQDYGERFYNTNIARFFSPDPLIVNGQEYPWYSPYQFAGNTPVQAIDLDGLEEYIIIRQYSNNINYKTLMVKVPNDERLLGDNVVIVYNVTNTRKAYNYWQGLTDKSTRNKMITTEDSRKNSSYNNILPKNQMTNDEQIQSNELNNYFSGQKVNKMITIPDVSIIYEPDQGTEKTEFSSLLSERDVQALNDMATLVNAKDVNATIVISGYASNKETTFGTGELGSEGNNLLAEARAKAAYDYLTQEMGVSAEYIKYIGKGTNPAPDSNGSGASDNQRVEVKLEVNDF